MKNALAAVTFAMVLLAATFGLRNAATSTVKAAGPAAIQTATATVGFNGIGDPAPSCPAKGCSSFAMNGIGDPAPSGPRSNSISFNGIGDPAPSGPRSNSMSF